MEAIYNDPKVATLSFYERIEVIDVLRGFALLGIIINHIEMQFLAGMTPAGMENYNIHHFFDPYISKANYVLTYGKFFTIFSFLFGLSFALQIESAKRKGASFSGRFIWRLAILFVIGFIHNMFFSGDILVIYAFLGLFLIPARNWSNKTLLIVGSILVLNAPWLIVRIIQTNLPPPSVEEMASQEEMMAQFNEKALVDFNIKKSGSLPELFGINAFAGLANKFIFQIITGRLWITYGLFLLGMYAGRRKIFENNVQNREWFRKFAWGTGLIAMVSTIFAVLYGSMFGQVTTFLDLVGFTAFDVHQVSLSAFYIAIVVLLYWKAKSRNMLTYLAPVGKMGLTTYLVQSAFGLGLFYGVGFGIMGEIGVAASVLIGILFFIVQILYSKIWLTYFTMGPVEWLWRAATYFKKPPFKKIGKEIKIAA